MRQVLMNALRASPLSDLACGSALHAFIFSCCVCLAAGAAGDSPLRQVLMKALRSSPVLPVACLLQSVMRCCCEFLAGALLVAACGAAKAEEAAKASARLATIRLKREDMRIPSWMTGECR